VQVGVAQQWYIDLEYLAAPKPELEITEDDNLDKNIVVEEDDNLDKNIVVEDDKIHIKSCVCTSPGTSEVCFQWYLFCSLSNEVSILHSPDNFLKIPIKPFFASKKLVYFSVEPLFNSSSKIIYSCGKIYNFDSLRWLLEM
jgi:hypothetical protein